MSDTFSTAGDMVTAAAPVPVPESTVRAGIAEVSKSAVPDDDAATASRIQQKYEEERNKRVRADGLAQYIEPSEVEQFRHFHDDPWLDSSTQATALPLEDGARCKFLILGAGYGGLLFAVRLIQAGFDVHDIRLVDTAGGFGGTWYWNRYPGLKCDVESYIYMPLLEETGYVPTHKYASGPELREYANLIADHWNLRDQALFQVKVSRTTWDEHEKEWVTTMTRANTTQTDTQCTFRSSFVISASGLFSAPKLPRFPGIDQFHGHSFHTSRWDYHYTGGSPEDPSLVHLRDQKVGILGTGATAVQAVPHLAKWAKQLYVFQRTPSSVDRRDNRPTDPTWWQQEIQGRPGWQRARMANFNARLANAPPDIDLVDDGWTHMPAFSGLIGGPKPVSVQDIPAHVASLYALDLPRAERVRARVAEIVHDKQTAEKLQAWHPAWCKRPCFSDDYLPTFNLPHVTLVDTDGQGAERVTATGLVANGVEHELDLLIFSTGYRAPGPGSPASRANMTVVGCGGRTLDEKFENGIGTLHGVISRDFPNYFFTGPSQSAAAANQMSLLDELSQHVAYMVAEAEKQSQKTGKKAKVTIEPSEVAEEAWSMRVVAGAASFAAMAGCTPGYLNQEGQIDQPVAMEQRFKQARGSIWGQGMADYVKVLEEWRARGGLEGLEVSSS